MSRDAYTLLDLTELAAHRALRHLPIALVSAIGSGTAAIEGRRACWNNEPWTKAVCKNITRLTGETNPNALRQHVLRNAENVGRLRAEYAILNRLARTDRIVVDGLENLKHLRGPSLFVMAHLSNWEVIFPVMASQKIAMTTVFDPPAQRARREIVQDVRASFTTIEPGIQFISTKSNTMRQCVNTLEAGKNLLIFVDEERDGLIWSPHLGRQLPNQGNRFFVARLAQRFEAPIIPVRIKRTKGARFVCTFMPPLPMPGSGERQADTLTIADTIAEQVETWILEDLDEWFWLPQLNFDRKFPARRKARRPSRMAAG